jgi:hypothetical protein
MVMSMLMYGIGLVACVDMPAELPKGDTVQRMLLGKSSQAVIACAGAPASQKVQGEEAVLVYYKEASLLEESFPSSKSSFSKIHHGCRATVLFRNDRVSDVRYQSVPATYHDESHCHDIFEACVNQ